MGRINDAIANMNPAAVPMIGTALQNGLEVGRDAYAMHLKDKYVNPAIKNYLRTAYENSGWSGYSKAQTESMRMARDIARGNIAKAQGDTMASNMSLGQRLNYMTQAGANAMNTDAYKLADSLNNAQTTEARNQIGMAESNAGRQNELANRTLEQTGDYAKQGLNLLGMAESGEEETSTPTMDPQSGTKATSPNKPDFNGAVSRIRNAQASDDDLRTAYAGGYVGGPKTQAEYKRLGLIQ